jgi:hypothetical protein
LALTFETRMNSPSKGCNTRIVRMSHARLASRHTQRRLPHPQKLPAHRPTLTRPATSTERGSVCANGVRATGRAGPPELAARAAARCIDPVDRVPRLAAQLWAYWPPRPGAPT